MKHEWYTTRFVRYERILGPTQLAGRAAPSGVILNGPTGKTANLCTGRRFGDLELYLEFMLAKGSNSGVYLQGLYEMQIFDSWGSTEEMSTSDAGAIYHQWVDNRGVGGSAPRVNAARPPGDWQSYQAWFRTPRFDASGKRTEPARFLRVLLNGRTVQNEVVVERPDARGAHGAGSGRTSADAAGRSRTGCVSQHSRQTAAAVDRAIGEPPSTHDVAGDPGDGSDRDRAIEDLGSFRLKLETSLRQRRFAGVRLLPQSGQPHHGLTVDDVDTGLTEAIEIESCSTGRAVARRWRA